MLLVSVVLQSSQTDFATEAFGLEMYTYDYLLTILTASIIPVSIWLRPSGHAVLLSYVNGVYYGVPTLISFN
jgi:hypothetical protein